MEIVEAIREFSGDEIRYIKSTGRYFFYVRDIEEILDMWAIRQAFRDCIITRHDRTIYAIPECYNDVILITAHGLHKIIKYGSSPRIDAIRRKMSDNLYHARDNYITELAKLFPGETNVVIDGVDVDLYLSMYNISIIYKHVEGCERLPYVIICDAPIFNTIQKLHSMINSLQCEEIKKQETIIKNLRKQFGL